MFFDDKLPDPKNLNCIWYQAEYQNYIRYIKISKMHLITNLNINILFGIGLYISVSWYPNGTWYTTKLISILFGINLSIRIASLNQHLSISILFGLYLRSQLHLINKSDTKLSIEIKSDTYLSIEIALDTNLSINPFIWYMFKYQICTWYNKWVSTCYMVNMQFILFVIPFKLWLHSPLHFIR